MRAPQEALELDEAKTRAIMRRLAADAARARIDPVKLYGFVMREEKTRRRITAAPHQKVIIEFIMAHPRCVVRAPVGFGKSYCCAAITLFLLGENPGERCAMISSTVGNAQKPVGMVRRYIEESQELALVFPALTRSRRRGEPWTQTRITVAREHIMRDPSLEAIGDQGTLAGGRKSWVLSDDLLFEGNTFEPGARKKTSRWFGSSVIDRMDNDEEVLKRPSRLAFINTPWNPEDYTYELEAKPDAPRPGLGYPSLTMDAHGDVIIRNTDWDTDDLRPAKTEDPEGVRHRLVAHDSPVYARLAGLDPGVGGWVDERDEVPLWPEAYPWRALEAKRRDMPIQMYNRAFRCRVRDDGTAAVKTEWIEASKKKARELGHDQLVSQWAGGATFTGVDPAFGLKSRHDKTAIFTFALLPGGLRRILEVQVGRWPGPEMVSRILDAAKRYGSIVCVEGNAAQRLIRQWALERNVAAPVRTMNTGRNKTDPHFGVQSIFLEVENGAWLIPSDARGGCPPGVQEWVDDMLYYDPEKHTGDALMASWIAREHARKTMGKHAGGAALGGAAALAR